MAEHVKKRLRLPRLNWGQFYAALYRGTTEEFGAVAAALAAKLRTDAGLDHQVIEPFNLAKRFGLRFRHRSGCANIFHSLKLVLIDYEMSWEELDYAISHELGHFMQYRGGYYKIRDGHVGSRYRSSWQDEYFCDVFAAELLRTQPCDEVLDLNPETLATLPFFAKPLTNYWASLGYDFQFWCDYIKRPGVTVP